MGGGATGKKKPLRGRGVRKKRGYAKQAMGGSRESSEEVRRNPMVDHFRVLGEGLDKV